MMSEKSQPSTPAAELLSNAAARHILESRMTGDSADGHSQIGFGYAPPSSGVQSSGAQSAAVAVENESKVESKVTESPLPASTSSTRAPPRPAFIFDSTTGYSEVNAVKQRVPVTSDVHSPLVSTTSAAGTSDRTALVSASVAVGAFSSPTSLPVKRPLASDTDAAAPIAAHPHSASSVPGIILHPAAGASGRSGAGARKGGAPKRYRPAGAGAASTPGTGAGSGACSRTGSDDDGDDGDDDDDIDAAVLVAPPPFPAPNTATSPAPDASAPVAAAPAAAPAPASAAPATSAAAAAPAVAPAVAPAASPTGGDKRYQSPARAASHAASAGSSSANGPSIAQYLVKQQMSAPGSGGRQRSLASGSAATSSSSNGNNGVTLFPSASPPPPLPMPAPSSPGTGANGAAAPVSPATSSSGSNSAVALESVPACYRSVLLSELSRIKSYLSQRLADKEAELESRSAASAAAAATAAAAAAAAREREAESKAALAERAAAASEATARASESKVAAARSVLIDTLRQLAQKARAEFDRSLQTRRAALGRVVVISDASVIGGAAAAGRIGGMGGPVEAWEDGAALREATTRVVTLTQERGEIEALRKRLQKVRAAQSKKSSSAAGAKSGGSDFMSDGELLSLVGGGSGSAAPSATSAADDADQGSVGPAAAAATAAASASAGGVNIGPNMSPHDASELDEVLRLRLANNKREAAAAQLQVDDLEQQKKKLIKAERLFLDEAASKFAGYPIIDRRYLFLELLGKGGFSEVFRAFDLEEMCFVACKIHQLNPAWSEDRRRNYLRHVMRESAIQRALTHPRIVRLRDVFKIDSATLVTVLDLCEDGDLDGYLKDCETLPEKEARVIIMQVFTGLKYLNEQHKRVIHYDLKPANILFHKGEVKIADFGLSKLIDEQASSIELTSQGAGTLPYLPPECFVTAHRPHITSAVDVWSCGIILFQMLFGRRPFGDGQAGVDRVASMAQNAGAGGSTVEFPAKPAVSDTAKDFIRKCLAPNPTDRPEVLTVFEEPFFKNYKP